jgi:hypothetical protein
MCCTLPGLDPTPGLAQDGGATVRHHPWGRFQPGAWKLVRSVTETLDEQGVVASTSVTETKTTLTKVDPDGVTLDVEMGLEVAGRQFDAQPQCLRQGLYGEAAASDLKVKTPKPAQVTIEDRKILCRVQQVEFSGPNSKTTVNIYYSDTVAPYLLKRDSVTTDAEGKEVLNETSLDVIALEMPYRVLSDIKTTAYIKTVQKHPKGMITTLAVTSPDVPGGVVSHTSKEIDKSGRLIRRSTLELTKYGLVPEAERSGLFGRKWSPRLRKTSPRSPPW